MTTTVEPDVRLVTLAAMAFLHWRDTGTFPELMSEVIDGEALAQAVDRMTTDHGHRRKEQT